MSADNNKSVFQLLKALWFYIKPRRRAELLMLIFLTMIVSVAEIVSIGAILPFLGALTAPENFLDIQFLQPMFNWLNISEPAELLFPMTILFIVAAILSGIMRLILLWTQTRFGFAIGADISISVYRNSLYLPYSSHVSKNSSEFISGITNKTTLVVTQIILPILLIISASIIFMAIFATLLLVDPLVASIATLGFGGTYGIILFITKKQLLTDSNSISIKSNLLIKSLQEGFGGIRDILIDGAQEVYCKIFREVDLPLRKAQAGIVIIGQTPRFIVEAIGITILALLALYLSMKPSGISGAIPVIGIFALAAQRLLPILQQIYQSWTSIIGCSVLLKDILFYLNQGLPKYAELPAPSPIKFNKFIKLENLNFRYNLDGPSIIKGFSYKIKKGDRIGLIGSTGGGKSTLIDIIMGLLFQQDGKLYIDEQLISKNNYRSWQAHISHAPQNIFLADTTILENIAFGIPPADIDHDLVYDSAKKAQIFKTIESWGLKFNTLVGERGVKLSGGQRQRIGIARALYKQTDVIIFDEATSALDNQTELKVINSIFNLNPDITILMIAHRLTTLRHCSQIIELEDGKVLRCGTFNKIINEKKI